MKTTNQIHPVTSLMATFASAVVCLALAQLVMIPAITALLRQVDSIAAQTGCYLSAFMAHPY